MKYIYFLLSVFSISLLASIINPKEGFTCFLEVIPAFIGFLILAFTFKKFRFTNFTYTLILIHCIILFIESHYTMMGMLFRNARICLGHTIRYVICDYWSYFRFIVIFKSTRQATHKIISIITQKNIIYNSYNDVFFVFMCH